MEWYVIICGYGCSGQNLVYMVEQEGIGYVVFDLDFDWVCEVVVVGEYVVYGDVVWCELLVVVGIYCVVVVVVMYVDMVFVLKVLYYVQVLELILFVIVCIIDDVDLDWLQQVGVIEVVFEIIEGSLMLVLYVLVLLGVLLCCVVWCVQEMCDVCYSLLCGYFYGQDDEEDMFECDVVCLYFVLLVKGLLVIGYKFGMMGLEMFKMLVMVIWCQGICVFDFDLDMVLELGDIVVLCGIFEGLQMVEEWFLLC